MEKSSPQKKQALLQQKIGSYEQLLDCIPALIYVNSFAEPHNPSSLVNIWCNSGALQFIAYSNDEIAMLGDEFFPKIIHPDDLEVIGAIASSAFKHGSGFTFNFLHRLKPKIEGQFQWMLGQGVVLESYPDGFPKTTLCFNAKIDCPMQTSNELSLVVKGLIQKQNEEQVNKLTRREIEKVQQIAHGLTDKEISEKLFISPKTTKTHRNHVMRKLGTKNNVSLTAFAVKNGLV